jgi:predicted nucleic-acid-binding Zn-ribbon protein
MNDDENTIALPASCPVCSGTELYVRRISSGGGGAPYYLAGLGKFLHTAEFDVVVCADCGLTQFFAEPLARKNVRNHPDWRRIRPRHPQPGVDADLFEGNGEVTGPDDDALGGDGGLNDPDDDSAPTRCLDCRSVIPAGADTCPKCGWTYKGED